MPKTILILAANPKDTPRLRLDQEVREIENGLSRSKQRDNFVLKQLWATRPTDIRRAMLDFQPNIVHFCGHGAGEDGIAFEDDNGNTKLVSADALSGLFNLFSDSVECILLNACYSEVQAESLRTFIKYVVGMKKGIGDSAAIEFAVAFYDAIGAGKNYEFAYKLGCNAIQWTGFPEHLTPILKTKLVISRELKYATTYAKNSSVELDQMYNKQRSTRLRAMTPREFVKSIGIPNPIDEEVLSFALDNSIKIHDNDPNATNWASIRGLRTYPSIEGFWSSRWYHQDISRGLFSYELDGKFWFEGTAQITLEEDWGYIYYEDETNQYAIIAKVKESLLIGRYINVNLRICPKIT